MNIVAKVLGELISEYHDLAKAAGTGCRLLVPGITGQIGRGIQEFLRSRGIGYSYLIIDRLSGPPDKSKGWMYADGLTTMREGSLVAVCMPSELAYLQDSIKGSGGAIRSMAFSDEWPWVDNGPESFRFEGPFLQRLINHWELGDDGAWVREMILGRIRNETRTMTERARVLFEDILGSFEPRRNDRLSPRDRFLFHCGAPRPAVPGLTVGEYVEQALRLSQAVVETVKSEDDTRREVLGRIDEMKGQAPEREELAEAANEFLDRLSQQDHLVPGVLGFSGTGTESRPSIESWEKMDTDVIHELFNVPKARPATVLDYRLLEGQWVIDEDQRNIVAPVGALAKLEARYHLPAEVHQEGDCRLVVIHRGTELASSTCPPGHGTAHLEFSLAGFGNSRGRVPLKVMVLQGGNELAAKGFSAHICSDKRPGLLILQSPFKVLDLVPEDQATNPELINVSGPVAVSILARGGNGSHSILVEGDPAPFIESTPLEGFNLCRASLPLDPSGTPSGSLEVSVRPEVDGAGAYNLVLSAVDSRKGEFTLEEELMAALAAGLKGSATRKLTAIFSGDSSDPYPRLGKIEGPPDRLRCHLAREVLEGDADPKPILADLLFPSNTTPTDLGIALSLFDGPETQPLRGRALSTKAKELHAEYASRRRELIQHVRGFIAAGSGNSDHPLYASNPTFVEAKRQETEHLLCRFLGAYGRILEALQPNQGALNPLDRFVLGYLDCVVHYRDNPKGVLRGSFFLMGPWHPVACAKRFLSQSILLSTAKRHLGATDLPHQARRLVGQLGQAVGFSWWIAPGNDGKPLPAHMARTNDPGWLAGLIAVPGPSKLPIKDICEGLKSTLGLMPSFMPYAGGNSGELIIRSFMSAHPSRRRLGINVSGGLEAGGLVRTAYGYLHGEDGPEPGAAKLPGGIHVVTNDDGQGCEPIGWVTPPVVLYHASKPNSTIENYRPDILILPPPENTEYVTTTGLNAPRGSGDHSILFLPLAQVDVGIDGKPAGLLIETDTGRTPAGAFPAQAGDAFVWLLSKAGTALQASLAQRRKASLPYQLKCPWAVIPSSDLDPAILVEYVREGARLNEDRALWSYQVGLSGHTQSHFILSMVPPGVRAVINGSPVLAGADLAKTLLSELGEIGIAVGGEMVKSGKNALGVIGLAGAARLLRGCPRMAAPLTNDERSVGVLIPVDSFQEILGSVLEHPGSEKLRRTDLMAIQLQLGGPGRGLSISACAVECKYVSASFPEGEADNALDQARQTLGRFKYLVESALEPGGGPELVTLSKLLWFVTRLAAGWSGPGKDGVDNSRDGEILSAVLQGRFEWVQPRCESLLVTTEAGRSEPASIRKSGGWWVRIGRGNWPGIDVTDSLEHVGNELSTIFRDPAMPFPGALPVPGDGHDPVQPALGTPRPGAEASGQEKAPVLPSNPPDASVQKAKGEQATANKKPDGLPGAGDFPAPIPVMNLPPVLLGASKPVRPIYFEPHSASRPLDNLNIMVTGSPGKGKTSLIKSLVCQIRSRGINTLLIDFKNDFASDQQFMKLAGLRGFTVAFDGLPFNPLIPYPACHPQTGKQIILGNQHIGNIGSLLDKAWSLGDQQEARLRNAMRDCYLAHGVNPAIPVEHDPGREFPDLAEVGMRLAAVDQNAMNRLDPLFSLGIFRPEYVRSDFASLLGSSTVIDLSSIPDDRLKNALSRIIIYSAHGYYNSQPHSRSIRQFLVLDEAHRVLETEFVSNFVRECRAYGVGMVLSSQFISDFPLQVSGGLSTKLVHGNDRDEVRVREISTLLGMAGNHEAIAGLGMFDCIASNRQFQNAFFQTFPYPVFLLCRHALLRPGITRQLLLHECNGIDRTAYLLDYAIQAGFIVELDGKLEVAPFVRQALSALQ